jgi:hypothetical protein
MTPFVWFIVIAAVAVAVIAIRMSPLNFWLLASNF